VIRRALRTIAGPPLAILAAAGLVAAAAGQPAPALEAGADAERVAPGPILVNIDRADIERALAIGRADEETRARFHAAYGTRLDGPDLRELVIQTEFRRVVTAAERAPAGWGHDDAVEMLRPFRGLVTLTLSVVFPPQNVYVTMPSFSLVLHGRPGTPDEGHVVRPVDLRAVPRTIPGVVATPGSTITGGTIEASFDGRGLDTRGTWLVGVFEREREIRRIAIDFARIE
jgi:hypothetical protein